MFLNGTLCFSQRLAEGLWPDGRRGGPACLTRTQFLPVVTCAIIYHRCRHTVNWFISWALSAADSRLAECWRIKGQQQVKFRGAALHVSVCYANNRATAFWADGQISIQEDASLVPMLQVYLRSSCGCKQRSAGCDCPCSGLEKREKVSAEGVDRDSAIGLTLCVVVLLQNRNQVLQQAASDGAVKDYGGWRVSLKGKRFRIKDVRLFNVTELDGMHA